MVYAKIGTDVYFNMSASLEDPLGDPAISDSAVFTGWLNLTIVNPSARRLTLHTIAYSGWIHDYEVENGSAPERQGLDDFVLLEDGTLLRYFRSFVGNVLFPTPTEFVEPHAQGSFSFPFHLDRSVPLRFDSTRSIVRFAWSHNLTWSEIDWHHHAVVQIQILGVPTNYEETTSIYYLHTFPIIEREAGYELAG